jgi:Type II secretion system (T2SS), protein M subtype b
MIWREKRVLLIILGVLLAANTFYFFTYRLRYETRLQDREQDLAQKQAELEQANASRVRAERTFQSYKQIEKDVQQVYDQHWATQEERFTQLVAEVKRLALASSMTPQAYGFVKVAAADSDAAAAAQRRKRVKIGANEVGITFTVDGTYEQVQRLINLLELSRQFVIIDQVSLQTREGQVLTLNLRLKTLFREGKPLAGNQL